MLQINRDRVAIFDFWAAWCGPCSTISPVFEKLSETFKDIDFYKVNVDEHEDIADKAGINAVRRLGIS
jgi:thioredoxin 1